MSHAKDQETARVPTAGPNPGQTQQGSIRSGQLLSDCPLEEVRRRGTTQQFRQCRVHLRQCVPAQADQLELDGDCRRPSRAIDSGPDASAIGKGRRSVRRPAQVHGRCVQVHVRLELRPGAHLGRSDLRGRSRDLPAVGRSEKAAAGEGKWGFSGRGGHSGG
uniref:(northern house mosquito) hypothetical protein n=1 Tax=Culex pipiens TaxID=7175 RepID=A0A8D8DRN2_CULPI